MWVLAYVCVCVTETTKLFVNGVNHSADSATGEERDSKRLNGSDLDHRDGGMDTRNELIPAPPLEVKGSGGTLPEFPSSEELKTSSVVSMSQTKRGINVKEILKSLVASPVEGLKLEPESHPDPAAKVQVQAQRVLTGQFHSFDR